MPALRFAFVVNPAAGRGRAEAAARRLAGDLRRAGAHASTLVTERADDTSPLAAQAAAASNVVIAAGGDGTASHVARGLLGTDAALFVLPVGTGNDFAQSQGVLLRGVTAARLLAGSALPIDVGSARWTGGHATFLNGLGIGFDARVAQAVPARRNLGALAYTAAAFDAWAATARLSAPQVRIVTDETLLHDGPLLMAAIGNTDRQGGGFRFTPDAQPADGRLDACLAAPLTLPRAIALAARSRIGRHGQASGIRIASFRRMTLASDQLLPIHADGEVVTDGANQVQVEVMPSALQLWTI